MEPLKLKSLLLGLFLAIAMSSFAFGSPGEYKCPVKKETVVKTDLSSVAFTYSFEAVKVFALGNTDILKSDCQLKSVVLSDAHDMNVVTILEKERHYFYKLYGEDFKHKILINHNPGNTDILSTIAQRHYRVSYFIG